MKRLHTLRCILSCAAALAAVAYGCHKPDDTPDEPDDKPVKEATFTISVDDITPTTAMLTVRHDGESGYPYYVFSYTDVDTKVEEAIARQIKGIKDGEIRYASTTGKNREILADGLEQGTEYRYVVVGLEKVDGEYVEYGTPGSVSFTTGVLTTKFSISVTECTHNSATVAVQMVSGREGDTWHAFVAEASDGVSVDDLVEKEIAGQEDMASVLKTGNQTLEFSGLEPEKDYVAIVAAVDKDGKVYGIGDSKTFKTPEKKSWKVNEDWEFFFAPFVHSTAGLLYEIGYKNYGKMGGIYYGIYDKEKVFEKFETVAAFAEALGEDLPEILADEEEDISVDYPMDYGLYYSGRTLEGETYLGVMIGVDPTTLKPTCEYQYKEFTIYNPDELDEEYASWCGTWNSTASAYMTYSGKTGFSRVDEENSQKIYIVPKDPEAKTYWVNPTGISGDYFVNAYLQDGVLLVANDYIENGLWYEDDEGACWAHYQYDGRFPYNGSYYYFSNMKYGKDPVFGIVRRDDDSVVGVGLKYKLAPAEGEEEGEEVQYLFAHPMAALSGVYDGYSLSFKPNRQTFPLSLEKESGIMSSGESEPAATRAAVSSAPAALKPAFRRADLPVREVPVVMSRGPVTRETVLKVR